MSKAIGLDGLRLSVQALMHQIRKKADKNKVVSSINGQTGDVKIDLDPEGKAIPDYVVKEAESIVEKIYSTVSGWGNSYFLLAAITDTHYGQGGYTDGVKHACQALKYINQRIKLDAIAMLGDYSDAPAYSESHPADVDIEAVNVLLDDMRIIKNLRLYGNHDLEATALVYTVSHYSDADSRLKYTNDASFYKDFEESRLRIICLNITYHPDGTTGIDDVSLEWFADALDLSAKPDAENWQVLILSHQPLDFDLSHQSAGSATPILDAYLKGGSYSVNGVEKDFAGKNSAVIIGNIHGHLHNLLIDKIYNGGVYTGEQIDVLRICTPEACYGRANGYGGAWHEDVTYDKEMNTARDTSFVVYCINPGAKSIRAFCYGAGRDRVIEYQPGALWWDGMTEDENGGESSGYTNQIPIAIDQNGNTVIDGAMYTDSRWSSSGGVSAQEGYFISGLIPAKPGDFVRVRWNNTEEYGDVGYQGVRAFGADRTPIATRLPFQYMFDPSNEAGAAFTAVDGFYYDRESGVLDFQVLAYSSIPAETEYLTFTLTGSPSDVIITVNEEIV